MMSVKSSHLWFKLAEQRPNKAITSQSALVMTPLPSTHHSPPIGSGPHLLRRFGPVRRI